MPNGTQVMKALQILSVFSKEDLSMCPEHDEIWIGHDIPPDKLDAAAKKTLKALGFDWDEDASGWHGFVSA